MKTTKSHKKIVNRNARGTIKKSTQCEKLLIQKVDMEMHRSRLSTDQSIKNLKTFMAQKCMKVVMYSGYKNLDEVL